MPEPRRLATARRSHRPYLLYILVALAVAADLTVAGYAYGVRHAAPSPAVSTPQPSNDTAPTPKTYSDELGAPLSFKYPVEWNVYTGANLKEDGVTSIRLSPLTLGDCSSCGGYFGHESVTINLASYGGGNPSVDNPTSTDNFIASLQDSFVVDKKIVTQLTNGSLTHIVVKDASTIPCDAPGCGLAPKEFTIFEPKTNTPTNGTLVIASFNKKANLPAEEEAGWNLITSTLDFSKF